jgi:diguanylate cyclase (GGDEF)-like protein
MPPRRLVGTIAVLTALTIAVAGPLLYAVDRYVDETRALAFRADLGAGKVAKYIYSHGALWQYQNLRLVEIIALPAGEHIHQQVTDRSGRVVAEEGVEIGLPRLRWRAPIVVAGERVGDLAAATSLRPMLADLGLVTLGCLGLALLTFFAVRMLPLRALDRTLAELAVQNLRFAAALDNMTQGLCMLDARQRLAVVNRRFTAMFGIGDGGALIEAAPRRLVEAARAANGLPDALGEDLFLFPAPGDPADAFSRDLPDGRSITVTRQPVAGGGWVATFEDITDRRRAEAKLDHMALHDALTGLPNRVLLRAHLEREVARTERGEFLAVLCLDLDRFKTINDTLGHPVGDALLQAVAARLKQCCRDSDIVARQGGDEFAIIQSPAEQPAHATALARRLVEVISAPYQLAEFQVIVGVSIGIAVAPADGRSADEILKNADLALYRAKAEGRGTYCFFEAAMDRKMQARRALELDLRTALAHGELELYFQPLVNLLSGRVTSFEALLRWRHPRRGIVPPLEFVPLAEEIGLIIPIGDWVLREACREAATWPDEIKVAVNLSVVQFRNPLLVAATQQALGESGLPASRLQLEITESVLMEDSQPTLATLRQLHELGIQISMDDFGTGYSSLSYLRSFPFDNIKIDQCFVSDIATNRESVAIVRAVVHLGRALGMQVIAEGIETEDQLAYVRAEGCAASQGFLFSAPVPADQLAGLLARLQPAARPAGIPGYQDAAA